jgi:uncharacterized FAD-dependent dehydrogenase
MIRINQLKLPEEHTEEDIKKKAAKMLKIQPEAITQVIIRRRSLDARRKPELFYSYIADIVTANEKKIVHRCKDPQIVLHTEPEYHFPESGSREMAHRPVIIGTGPAGLFCGLMLARHGYRPLLLERGEDVDTRQKKVDHFWETGELDTRSNVQFGEGGAGTFSDGKLNTLVKDPAQRNHRVLEIFHEFGADASILYESKPHIGTDVLAGIVKRIREEIRLLGGEVRFGTQVTDLLMEDNKVRGVVTEQGEQILSDAVVLAIGHSARDTFEMLYERKIPMDQKSFAVGLRVQHPQSLINLSQYGREDAGNLGAASYKLTRKTSSGRGVYSFCMCPGGYVVNASSEEGRLAVNGMSYHDRAGVNANSALIVTVNPEDFGSDSPLAGIEFQRRLETLAYKAGGGKIPVQIFRDFKENRLGDQLGEIVPQTCGKWAFANLREVMPEYLSEALIEAMDGFGHMIHGFDRPDAVFAGIESRTSSPVRIWRNEAFESDISGLYPCGEGAGYAGGITSAAMDGVRVAEAIAQKFAPIAP